MKKSIIGIFIFVFSLCFCCVSGQYLYFSGTAGKHFKQGCTDSISMRYDTAGKSASLDRTAVIYAYVKYGLNLSGVSFSFFDTNLWEDKTPLRYDRTNRYFLFGVINKKAVNSGDNKMGTISFTPGYSQQDHYLTTFVFNQPGVQASGSFLTFNADSFYFYDTLTGDINVYQELCYSDGTPPNLGINYNNGTYKTKKELVINLKDDSGDSSSAPYIWSGAIKGTAGSYWTGNPGSVTNQDGIDIDDPNFQVTISGGALNNVIILHTGDFIVTPSNKTWEYKDRDYTLTTGLQGFDFGMEKAVTITVSSIKDRSNPSHSKDGISVTFNRPQGPSVSDKYPTAPSYIFRDAAVGFKVSDGWAGVDSGTITLTLSGYNYKQTFTADQLKITCATEGACGITGSAGGYNVYLSGSSHDKFPYGKPIYVTVSAKDLLGNAGGDSWQFGVVQDCITLGFLPPTEIRYGDNQAVSPYTGSELTISGSNVTTSDFEEYVLSGVTYTGRIFEVDCHQSDSALSLYNGTESNNEGVASGLLLDELVLSGANPEIIKAELDGNQLTLSYRVDSAEIILNGPIAGSIVTAKQVNLSGYLDEMNSYDWLSGFVVVIYTGDNTDNVVATGFIQTQANDTGFQTSLTVVDDRNDYYWYVYAVDKADNTGTIFSTGAFTVSVTNWRDTATVIIDEPDEDNEQYNTGTVNFEWHLSGSTEGDGLIGSMSGYIFELYSGLSCNSVVDGSTPYLSQRYGSGITGYSVNNLMDGNYCVKVYVVDDGDYTGNSASRSFSVSTAHQVTIVANLYGRQIDLNPNGYKFNSSGVILFYNCGDNFSAPIDGGTGYVVMDDNGNGVANISLSNGCYDVVYKGWQHLAAYMTGLNYQGQTINFVSGENIVGLYTSPFGSTGSKSYVYNGGTGFLLVGDIPIPQSDTQSLQDGIIDGKDYSALIQTCPRGELREDQKPNVCDLNNDGSVNVDDTPYVIGLLYSKRNVTYDCTQIDGTVNSNLCGGWGLVDYIVSK